MSRIQEILQPAFEAITHRLEGDREFRASALGVSCTFSIVSSENPEAAVVVAVNDGQITLDVGPASSGGFGLQARNNDWDQFFAKELVRPYQSYWGILRVLGHNEGIAVIGDKQAFGRNARIWRIFLDRSRDCLNEVDCVTAGQELPVDEETEDDAVTGKYTWIDHSEYGKVKIFYDFAGSGGETILFLHTAGSDSRQYHSLMNNRQLQKRCTMYAFDLPAHGRSTLGTKQMPQGYTLTEDSYLESISHVIKKLGLRQTIVCGASMAGHICLAAAIKAPELDIHGAIPCEGCEHLAFSQPIYEIGGSDISLLDPERVCGMCSPTSPEYYKRQIWWQYSSQGYGVFSGDLKFYFRGWDGRGRVETIDTKVCPVYMLTGEYDYSCTVEASKATAGKIPGAVFEAMEGLGHFPLTENPKTVLPYLLRALDHIQQQQQSG